MDRIAKPQPRPDPLTRPFFQHAKEGRLTVQQCDHCGDKHFPPSPICPHCNGDQQHWEPVSGRGTLESWIAFHRAYWPGFADDVPYDVCLVRLAEGPLLVSNLLGGTQGARLGAAVEVVFDAQSDELTLPKWRLSPSA